MLVSLFMYISSFYVIRSLKLLLQKKDSLINKILNVDNKYDLLILMKYVPVLQYIIHD